LTDADEIQELFCSWCSSKASSVC